MLFNFLERKLHSGSLIPAVRSSPQRDHRFNSTRRVAITLITASRRASSLENSRRSFFRETGDWFCRRLQLLRRVCTFLLLYRPKRWERIRDYIARAKNRLRSRKHPRQRFRVPIYIFYCFPLTALSGRSTQHINLKTSFTLATSLTRKCNSRINICSFFGLERIYADCTDAYNRAASTNSRIYVTTFFERFFYITNFILNHL